MTKSINVELTAILIYCLQPIRSMLHLECEPMSVILFRKEFGRLDRVAIRLGKSEGAINVITYRLQPYNVMLDIYYKKPLTLVQKIKIAIFKRILIKYIGRFKQC